MSCPMGLRRQKRPARLPPRSVRSVARILKRHTNRCVYENGWNDFSLMARLTQFWTARTAGSSLAASPKFFNAGERDGSIPDLPFEVFEKVDGSLAIGDDSFGGAWRASTKGAFEARRRRRGWRRSPRSARSFPACARCCNLVEAVYPENRIVVRYGKTELVLLAAYLEDGSEMTFDLGPLWPSGLDGACETSRLHIVCRLGRDRPLVTLVSGRRI